MDADLDADSLSSDDESLEEITGWKLVHGDVFRAPAHGSILAPIVGSGTQVIFMVSGPYLASKLKDVRTYVMIGWLLPSLTAIVLFWQLPRSNHGGLLAGYYMVSRWSLTHLNPHSRRLLFFF